MVLNLEVPLDFDSATQLIDKERIEWALPLNGPLLWSRVAGVTGSLDGVLPRRDPGFGIVTVVTLLGAIAVDRSSSERSDACASPAPLPTRNRAAYAALGE